MQRIFTGWHMTAVLVALLSELRLSRLQHRSSSKLASLTDEREVLRDREMLFRALVSYSGGAFGPVLNGAGRLPPTLVLSAGTTDAVPLADALALHRALVAHRVPTSLYVYPHGRHSWPGAQGRAALRRTEAFLRRWLG